VRPELLVNDILRRVALGTRMSARALEKWRLFLYSWTSP